MIIHPGSVSNCFLFLFFSISDANFQEMTEYKLKCRNIQQGIITPNHVQQQPTQIMQQMQHQQHQQQQQQQHHDDDSGDEDGDGDGEDQE